MELLHIGVPATKEMPNEKYKDAIKQYDIYLESHPADYVAQAGKYGCMQIEQWKKQPSRYKVALAKEFNEKRTSNFAPAFISEDGDALVFTSNRQEKSTNSKKKKVRTSPVTGAATCNLYSTRQNAAGEWEDVMLCEGLYQASEEESEEEGGSAKTSSVELGVCCFSPDGKTMYFTYSCPQNGQDLGAKIYTSTRASGEWGEGQELKLFSDSSITVGHPSLNAYGDTLRIFIWLFWTVANGQIFRTLVLRSIRRTTKCILISVQMADCISHRRVTLVMVDWIFSMPCAAIRCGTCLIWVRRSTL